MKVNCVRLMLFVVVKFVVKNCHSVICFVMIDNVVILLVKLILHIVVILWVRIETL